MIYGNHHTDGQELFRKEDVQDVDRCPERGVVVVGRGGEDSSDILALVSFTYYKVYERLKRTFTENVTPP